MSLQPIRIYGKHGPNPPKVTMVCNELDLPYEHDPISIGDVKKPEYLDINPNGRLPAIYDPNTDLTLWESGAIIEYLVEKYDKEYKLGFPAGTPEYYLAKQWLFFQVSGQGPYYGQAGFFKYHHKEKVPSAVKRYVDETKRVMRVLEGYLKKQKEATGEPWLVGGRYSYADLAFVPWQVFIQLMLKDDGLVETEFPTVQEWLGKMMERKAIGDPMKEELAVYRAAVKAEAETEPEAQG